MSCRCSGFRFEQEQVKQRACEHLLKPSLLPFQMWHIPPLAAPSALNLGSDPNQTSTETSSHTSGILGIKDEFHHGHYPGTGADYSLQNLDSYYKSSTGATTHSSNAPASSDTQESSAVKSDEYPSPSTTNENAHGHLGSYDYPGYYGTNNSKYPITSTGTPVSTASNAVSSGHPYYNSQHYSYAGTTDHLNLNVNVNVNLLPTAQHPPPQNPPGVSNVSGNHGSHHYQHYQHHYQTQCHQSQTYPHPSQATSAAALAANYTPPHSPESIAAAAYYNQQRHQYHQSYYAHQYPHHHVQSSLQGSPQKVCFPYLRA